jgi:hypothetical protein
MLMFSGDNSESKHVSSLKTCEFLESTTFISWSCTGNSFIEAIVWCEDLKDILQTCICNFSAKMMSLTKFHVGVLQGQY